LASETIAFYLFGVVAVAASLLVIAQRNPIYSVLLLIASFGAMSGLYVLLEAPFVAVIQIIVYAGAIMVLFLFVIMLLNLQAEALDLDARRGGGAGLRVAAWLGGAVLAAELAWLFLHVTLPPVAAAPLGYGGAVAVARSLFTDSALPFELTSILLLVAVIGAVVLGQRRTS